MPSRKCNLCKNSQYDLKKRGIHKTFFSFPRNENLRKKWIEACHIKIDNIVSARVCSDHFKEDDFFPSNKSDAPEESQKKRLRSDVVPSVNLDLNLESEELEIKLIRKNSDKENSKEIPKKKSVGRDNEKSKEFSKGKSISGKIDNEDPKHMIRRKTSVLTSDKENAEEPAKKKSSLRKTADENSNERPKKKNVSFNDVESKGLSKLRGKANKVSNNNNKENSKEMGKNKVSITKGTPKRKINKNNHKESIKRKNSSLNNSENLREAPKRKITKGITDIEEVNKKNSLANDDEDTKDFPLQKISKVINYKDCTRLSHLKNSSIGSSSELNDVTEKISIERNKQGNIKHVPKRKISVESNTNHSRNNQASRIKIGKAISVKESSKQTPKKIIALENNVESSITEQKTALERSDKDNSRKLFKRKIPIENGVPKKRRIRLGKSDDSEGSEDSLEIPVENYSIENDLSKSKITYNSPSEMAHNVDLLKYLNYLKEKKRPSDQPILFWVDD